MEHYDEIRKAIADLALLFDEALGEKTMVIGKIQLKLAASQVTIDGLRRDLMEMTENYNDATELAKDLHKEQSGLDTMSFLTREPEHVCASKKCGECDLYMADEAPSEFGMCGKSGGTVTENLMSCKKFKPIRITFTTVPKYTCGDCSNWTVRGPHYRSVTYCSYNGAPVGLDMPSCEDYSAVSKPQVEHTGKYTCHDCREFNEHGSVCTVDDGEEYPRMYYWKSCEDFDAFDPEALAEAVAKVSNEIRPPNVMHSCFECANYVTDFRICEVDGTLLTGTLHYCPESFVRKVV